MPKLSPIDNRQFRGRLSTVFTSRAASARGSFALLKFLDSPTIRGLKPAAAKNKSIHRCLINALLCFLLFASITRASITLPLEGYCKPGRYFPIQIDGPDAAHPTTLTADNGLPCDIDPATTGKTIAPMLMTGSPHKLSWADQSIALRMPGENERLIAGSSDDLTVAESLFPGKRLIPIQLDSSNPLPGPPVAWETLDAVLLDGLQFSRIDDAKRSALLSGGVMLISTGDTPPDHRWPWRKAGSVWVLSANIVGPIGEAINENIYAPTYTWIPGYSAAVRGQVMAVAILLVLLTAGLMLRPNRITITTAIALSIFTTAGIIYWRHSLGSADRAGGDIIIANAGLLQRDAVVYERAKVDSIQTIPWTGWTHPLFASQTGLNRAAMRLHISSNNELAFTYQTTIGHTIAFIRRDVQPGPAPVVTSSHDSPMQEAARAEYLSAGCKIIGEIPGIANRWPGVVIQNKKENH
jgi:hypothetical protein